MSWTIRWTALLGLGLLVSGCVEYRVDPVTGKEYRVENKKDAELDQALAQVEKDPDDARAWFQLGMVYERRAAYLDSLDAYLKMQEAVAKLEKTQKRRYTGGLYKIGETLVRLRRYPDAKAYLSKVLEIEPKDRRQAVLNLNFRKAHKLLAAIAKYVQDWEEAEKHALAFRALGGGNECDDILSAASQYRRPKVVEPSYEEEGAPAKAAPAGSKSTDAAKPPAKVKSPSDTPRK